MSGERVKEKNCAHSRDGRQCAKPERHPAPCDFGPEPATGHTTSNGRGRHVEPAVLITEDVPHGRNQRRQPVWHVADTLRGDERLGGIRFMPARRSFVFITQDVRAMDAGQLEQIARFLRARDAEWRDAPRAEQPW